MPNEGDKIELLGRKEVIAEPPDQKTVGVQPSPNTDVSTQLTNLQNQLNALIAAQAGKNVVQPDLTAQAAAASDEDPFANAQ